jgi:hypothetical protein
VRINVNGIFYNMPIHIREGTRVDIVTYSWERAAPSTGCLSYYFTATNRNGV